VTPAPFYKAPNNWFGRVTGVLFRIPGLAEDAYTVLKEQFKLSDVTILFLVLAVPVTVGMLCIFVVDMYIVSSERKASAERRMREALLAAQRQQQAAMAAGAAAAEAAGEAAAAAAHPHYACW